MKQFWYNAAGWAIFGLYWSDVIPLGIKGYGIFPLLLLLWIVHEIATQDTQNSPIGCVMWLSSSILILTFLLHVTGLMISILTAIITGQSLTI